MAASQCLCFRDDVVRQKLVSFIRQVNVVPQGVQYFLSDAHFSGKFDDVAEKVLRMSNTLWCRVLRSCSFLIIVLRCLTCSASAEVLWVGSDVLGA